MVLLTWVPPTTYLTAFCICEIRLFFICSDSVQNRRLNNIFAFLEYLWPFETIKFANLECNKKSLTTAIINVIKKEKRIEYSKILLENMK